MPRTEDEKKQLRAMRLLIADAFSFVRSQESNKALAAITLDQLMAEQISRNGESSDSEKSVYSPYTYDPKPESETPASTSASSVSPAFSTGINAQQVDGVYVAPSKLDRLEAINETLESAISAYLKLEDQFDLEIDKQEEDGPVEELGTYDSDGITHLSDTLAEE